MESQRYGFPIFFFFFSRRSYKSTLTLIPNNKTLEHRRSFRALDKIYGTVVLNVYRSAQQQLPYSTTIYLVMKYFSPQFIGLPLFFLKDSPLLTKIVYVGGNNARWKNICLIDARRIEGRSRRMSSRAAKGWAECRRRASGGNLRSRDALNLL